VTATTILGLDPGLRSLGWGFVRAEGNRLAFLSCGTIATDAGEALALRLKFLCDELSAVVARLQPTSAAVEETFVNRDMRAAIKLAQARAIALLVPAQAGIAVAEYAPNLVKKSVVGAGHATKEQIRVMVGHLLPGATPQTEHEADALAVAIAHAHLAQTADRIHAAVAR
jgi:crossover junction endodeoxyribonuclease RuvC